MKKLMVLMLSLLTVCLYSFPLVGCKEITAPVFGEDSSSLKIDSSTPDFYTVKFETNGGTSIANKQTDLLLETPKTYKTDYTFDGWYFDRELTSKTMFPLEVNYDLTLYAKWLNLTETKNVGSYSIKNWTDYDSSVSWFISPSKLDLEALKQKGYRYLSITVYYDVCYEKDYEKPLDIGYMGSPKYKVALEISDGYAKNLENLETTTQWTDRSFSFTHTIEYFLGQRLHLYFSTANIQNIVHLRNIRVQYTCT